MNAKFDYSDKINIASQLYRTGVGHQAPKMPVFLHFSDIHDHEENFARVMDFYSDNRELITDIVLTGDIVNDRFPQNLKPSISDNLENMLCVVGNHDSLACESGWDWSQVVGQDELYELFFKDRGEKHGIVLEKGKTYWYKDFDAYKLRMIGLNSVLGAEPEQLGWLEGVLTEARDKGFHVIIAEHYPPSMMQVIPCNFSSVMQIPAKSPNSGLNQAVQKVVADFKSAGGEFVCYLCGHTHIDYIAVNENYPDQLFVTVDASHYGHANYWSDTYRMKGTQSQDLFNLFSYDIERKLVKIVRIGANADCLLRPKNSLCINYITGEIIAQN